MSKKITIDAEKYKKTLESEIPLLSRESRDAYLKCLALLLTITTTILLGFISFSKTLGLYEGPSKILTISTIILLSLAFLSISMAITLFLCSIGTSLYKLYLYNLKANFALLKGEKTIELDDERLFINYYIAMAGFILFNFGFANLVLSLYITLIYPLTYSLVIGINIMMFIIFLVIFVPFIKKNKKISTVLKEVSSKILS